MKTTIKSLALSALTSLSLLGIASAETKEKKTELHTAQILEDYIAVTNALYKDDLEAAMKATGELVAKEEESALVKAAKTLAEAKDIAAARVTFKELSAEAARVAKAVKSKDYTVMECPMVKGGSGVWLSADGKVNNPYFGAKMAHCGGPKK